MLMKNYCLRSNETDQFPGLKVKVQVVFLIATSLQSLSETITAKFKNLIDTVGSWKISVETTVVFTNKDASTLHDDEKTDCERAKLRHVIKYTSSTCFYKTNIAKIISDKQNLSQVLVHVNEASFVVRGSGISKMASGNQDFGVLETFRSYFPTCGSELITLPCLDRCLSNTLFSTNEKGTLEY